MNTLDINQYRARFDDLRRILKRNPDKDRIKWLSELCFETYIHIVAIECFIMEIEGETPEMLEKLKNDMKFFDYQDIGGYNGSKSW